MRHRSAVAVRPSTSFRLAGECLGAASRRSPPRTGAPAPPEDGVADNGCRLKVRAWCVGQTGRRSMRRMMLVPVVVLALLALAPSASAGDNFVATLSGSQEVPARDTQAVGVAKFKL